MYVFILHKCMHAYTHVYKHTCVSACAVLIYACEGLILLNHSPYFLQREGLSSEPRAHPFSAFWALELQTCHTHPTSMWALEIWALILTFAQPAL